MRRSAASLLLGLACALPAAEPALALGGQVTHLSGAVIARRADGGSRVLSMRSEVSEGDVVITSDSSYARIKWTDGGETVLRPGTQLKIDAYKYEEGSPQNDNVVMSLLKGGMRSVTGLLGRRNPGQYRVATPNATIGIRGTHFGILMCNNDCGRPGGAPPPNGLHVDVADGIITVTNAAGTAEFRVGQTGFVQSFNAPAVQVPPEQATRASLPPQATRQNVAAGGGGGGGDTECRIPQ